MGSYVELLRACKEGNPKKVKKLLCTCKSIGDVRDPSDKTILHYCFQNEACTNLVLEIAPELLDVGEKSGYTVLHLASMMKPPTPLQYLLSKNPDINKKTKNLRTPLLLAVIYDNSDAIEILCECDAEVNVTDCLGVSPLHYAAKSKSEKDEDHQLKIIDILLKYKAKIEFPDSYERTPLIWAVSSNNLVKMRHLISMGANINAKDNNGLSIMHYATSNGNVEIIETLLSEFNFDIDTFDNNGCTSLMYACTMSQSNVVHVLLDKGANVNAEDVNKRSAVHFACGKGDIDTMKILANHNADLWKSTEDCNFPLHEASFKGHEEIVKFFLTHCDPNKSISDLINTKNTNGQTPLHLASVKDHIDICRILLEKGADPNIILQASSGKSMTALDLANRASTKELIGRYKGKIADDLTSMCPIKEESTYSSSVDSESDEDTDSISASSSSQIIYQNNKDVQIEEKLEDDPTEEKVEIEVTETLRKFLLECCYKGDVDEIRSFALKGVCLSDIFDNSGKNLLHYSIKNRSLFELVLELAADLVNKCDFTMLSVLNMVIMSREPDNLKLLLEHDADYNFCDESGRTSLHLAVIYNNLEALKILNRCIADCTKILHKPDKDGNYPLHYAVELYKSKEPNNQCKEFIEILLEMNGDIESRDLLSRTPLLLAVNINNMEAVKTLLEHGADILSVDKNSLCSIHYACSEGRSDILDVLSTMGNFDPDIRDQNGLTPIFYAVASCNDKIVQHLLNLNTRVDIKDKYGRNLCHKASEKGAFKCLELLLACNVDPWLKSNDGTMPLHEAAYRGYKEVAEILINTPDSRKYINVKNLSGQTALHLAAVRNDCPMCFLLINNGSSVNELLNGGPNDSDVTPYDLATTQHCKETLHTFGGRSAKRVLDTESAEEYHCEDENLNALPELRKENFNLESQYSVRSTELALSTLPSMLNNTSTNHERPSLIKVQTSRSKKKSRASSTKSLSTSRNNANTAMSSTPKNTSKDLPQEDDNDDILQSSKSSKTESDSLKLSLGTKKSNSKVSTSKDAMEKEDSFLSSVGTQKSTSKSSKRSKINMSSSRNKSPMQETIQNVQERVHTSILNYEFIRLNSKVACEIARQQIRRENVEKLINPKTPKTLRRTKLKKI